MVTKLKLTFYLLFILSAGIWLGSAFHDSLSNNIGWYKDPVTYIEHSKRYPMPGAINAWPVSTALVTLFTLLSLVIFFRYKGPGRSVILTSLAGTVLIIGSTFLYFVPTLFKIFGAANAYSDTELISMSRQWIILNLIRFIALVFLFILALLGLLKLKVKGFNVDGVFVNKTG